MPNNKVVETIRKEIPYLKEHFGVKKIGLFGSFAKGTQRDSSDVDILAEFERPIGLDFMDFAEHLERLLGRKVDILTPAGLQSIRTKRVAQEIKESLIYV